MNHKQPISKIIRDRLAEANQPFFANDNISAFISDEERELLKLAAMEKKEVERRLS